MILKDKSRFSYILPHTTIKGQKWSIKSSIKRTAKMKISCKKLLSIVHMHHSSFRLHQHILTQNFSFTWLDHMTVITNFFTKKQLFNTVFYPKGLIISQYLTSGFIMEKNYESFRNSHQFPGTNQYIFKKSLQYEEEKSIFEEQRLRSEESTIFGCPETLRSSFFRKLGITYYFVCLFKQLQLIYFGCSSEHCVLLQSRTQY